MAAQVGSCLIPTAVWVACLASIAIHNFGPHASGARDTLFLETKFILPLSFNTLGERN